MSDFAGGTGTEQDPYLVETAQHFNNVRGYINSYFKQISDIDLSVYENFTAIPTGFNGVYDGNFNIIGNITINATSTMQGLFRSTTAGAVIKNLVVKNINVASTSSVSIGAIAGRNEGLIKNCRVKEGLIIGENEIGGIIGINRASGTIERCQSDIFVNGGLNNGASRSGGITGRNEGLIKNCCSYGRVNSLSELNSKRIGGLVGQNAGGEIINSFSVGAVTLLHPSGASNFGGLVGVSTSGVTESSYWNTEASGQLTSAGGVGKTTQEMFEESTFEGWDFVNIWVTTGGYPQLRVFAEHELYPKIITSNIVPFTSYNLVQGQPFVQTVFAKTGFLPFKFTFLPVSNSTFIMLIRIRASDGILQTVSKNVICTGGVPQTIEFDAMSGFSQELNIQFTSITASTLLLTPSLFCEVELDETSFVLGNSERTTEIMTNNGNKNNGDCLKSLTTMVLKLIIPKEKYKDLYTLIQISRHIKIDIDQTEQILFVKKINDIVKYKDMVQVELEGVV